MAEFCLKCFNEMNGTHYEASEVWLEEDFCEGCAEAFSKAYNWLVGNDNISMPE